MNSPASALKLFAMATALEQEVAYENETDIATDSLSVGSGNCDDAFTTGFVTKEESGAGHNAGAAHVED
jgi:hypothetical protein